MWIGRYVVSYSKVLWPERSLELSSVKQTCLKLFGLAELKFRARVGQDLGTLTS